MSKRPEITKEIKTIVEARGLTFLGIAGLALEPDFARFRTWLSRGDHAGMDYLERNQHLREDPAQLMPGARSVIVVGLDYYLGDKLPGRDEAPRIAQYARLRDYHKLMWKAGEEILEDYWALRGARGEGRVVVDSAPILERAMAARAGGGFIGKNTCLIDPQRGSFFLIGEILVSDSLADDAVVAPAPAVDPELRTAAGGCGTCKRCQVHCPTGALDEAYRLDANKCLAYWTIEHRGTIPERFWPWLKLYVFGCDICQLACPYNRGAEVRVPADVLRVHGVPDLFAVATMDQAVYERLFGGTPLTRAKREGLVRNALISMTVTDDARLDEAIAHCAAHPAAPVVTETLAQMAVWRQAATQGPFGNN